MDAVSASASLNKRKRCAFAISEDSNNARIHSESQTQPRRTRQKPGGLCHIAPALRGSIGAPEIPVLTTKDSRIIQRWLEEHVPSYSAPNKNSCSILGFDVESISKPPWMPERASLPDGPATIQLSTPGSCLIVQLSQCGDGSALYAPSVLRDVINNRNIIKVGVGIDDDALELYRWSKKSNNSSSTKTFPRGVSSLQRNRENNVNSSTLWEMTSRFDIGCILPSSNASRRLGLRDLANTILGVELEKNKKLAMSNWGLRHLSPSQICYAARDAWVSAAILERLQRDNNKVFGLNALLEMEFMKKQRSMKEVDERAAMRKRAKEEMKSLLKQAKEGDIANDHRYEKRMKELAEALDIFRPDPLPSFGDDAFVLPFY
ncbi:hypothetical protein HJC23_002307 [Cyclotella cryptica]|uniref:3'-5' exonuclease domain-containing protein n=1 Tax=Cyclotella cryptica TaxID=29204 RepID=A0ABD3QLV0_9STRA